MSRKTIGLVVVAVTLGSTACDRSPLEVTGTSANESLLAPSFVSLSPAAKSLSFNENFNPRNPKPDMLQATGSAPSYATGAAVFAGLGYDRGYLRTIAANYNTTSFRAEVTVSIPGGYSGTGIAFFGFGRGEPNCSFFCEAYTDPAIYLRIMPSDFYGPNVEATSSSGGTLDTALGEGGNGTHRLRLVWDAGTRKMTLSIMSNYVDGAEFAPTAVMGPYVLGPEFDATNSHIFLGGAGMDSFDNLNVKATR